MGEVLQFSLNLLGLLLEPGLFDLAFLKLGKFASPSLLDSSDLGLHLLEGHSAGVGLLLEDGHL